MITPDVPPFSGSYPTEDVHFLLRPVDIIPLSLVEKERRLLSGQAHYAEMLSEETLPDALWRTVVEDAMTHQADAMARRHRWLATRIGDHVPGEIVLVSLARAGTPTGVVLGRLLRHAGRRVYHYSVSLVLRRGLDAVALDFIRSRHADAAIVFVDGWTGKGSIAAELRTSLERYRADRGAGPAPRLAVLCDLAGVAEFAADADDTLIPHALLGAVGSGLISRTLLSETLVAPGQFHACRYYAEWTPFDLSLTLADRMTADAIALRDPLGASPDRPPRPLPSLGAWLARHRPEIAVQAVKPGICESIRALLRRTPRMLLVRETDAVEVAPLRILAERIGIPITAAPDLPYHAMTIIQAPAP